MFKIREIFLCTILFLSGSVAADIIGDFSRANCVTNNESITFRPFDPFLRSVVSWHTLDGNIHYAGDEDPVAGSQAPCPTSPSILEDARCEPGDNCWWPFSYHAITGRWAAIHSVYGLDSESTTGWTVEGHHATIFGYFHGIPIYTINLSLPTTDCNL
ncbi:MAG TPA: hypothetical protein DCE52_13650 [Rhodobacteraceae bacterium]|nr:hypothetical protein [Paracoccaceae bacterium]